MKYIEEMKLEFAGIFGDEFKLEQFNGNSYRLVDSHDIIWMDGIDLNSASWHNYVKAVINHSEFFINLVDFFHCYYTYVSNGRDVTARIDIDDISLSHTSMFVSEKGLKFGVNVEGTIDDKINVQLGFEYNWQEKQFNYEILAWNPDATAFGLSHGLELFINSDATEPYKVAYYGMDVDVDILQPELTQALDKIVGLLK